MLSNYELAKKNYGRTWTAEMLVKLVEKGKLKETDYNDITGYVYPATEKIESEQ